MLKDDGTPVAGDHGADGAGTEVLGEGGGGRFWSGHHRQGKLFRTAFNKVFFIGICGGFL